MKAVGKPTAFALFNFLLQMIEQIMFKEFLNGDTETVAQLLNGGNSGAAVPSADNIIDGGLGHAAHVAQFVDGQIPFPAQIQNAQPHCFTDVHQYHLTST